MNDHVIDCCSLINLYTGWRGLSPLLDLNRTWHVCDAVFGESQYTRELGEGGAPRLLLLDLKLEVEAGVLCRARPESESELDDYVSFAIELDDGEAQALAIAKNRGFILLTDDKKAGRLAAEMSIVTITTPNVLRDWAERAPERKVRLPEIVRRITTLARFSPPAESPDYEWWRQIGEDR